MNLSAAGIFVYTAIKTTKRSLRMRITDEHPLHGLNGGVYKAPAFSTNKIGINRKQKMVHLWLYDWNTTKKYLVLSFASDFAKMGAISHLNTMIKSSISIEKLNFKT